ncbi:hypothetical protein MKW92_010181, partial [Papaver armeniacum]
CRVGRKPWTSIVLVKGSCLLALRLKKFNSMVMNWPLKKFWILTLERRQLDRLHQLIHFLRGRIITSSGRSRTMKIELQFFDSGSSSSASLILCIDNVCSSVVQTSRPGCSQNSQCSYQFKYLDGTGIAGFYVSRHVGFWHSY